MAPTRAVCLFAGSGGVASCLRLVKRALVDHWHARGVEVQESCLSYENDDDFVLTASAGAKFVGVGVT